MTLILRRSSLPALGGLLLAAILTACSSSDTSAPRAAAHPPSSAPTAPAAAATYVAVGASETVGVGADDPERQAWPSVLARTALPDFRFVNLGVSGSTVGEAIDE